MDGEGLVTTGLGGLWRWWRIGPQGRRELKRIYKQAIRDAVQDSATRRSAISIVNDPIFFDRVALPVDINQQTEKSEFGKRLRALWPNAKQSDIEEVVEQVFIHILRRLHHAQYQQWKEKSAEWKANNPTAAGAHEPVLKSQAGQLRVERLLGGFEPQSPQGVTRTFLAAKKLSNTQFYGRQWLYDDVVNWLQTDTEVVYWLQADAGFGKSSFCSRLSLGWDEQLLVEVGAIVFCDRSTTPYAVLREICRQLRNTSKQFAESFDKAWEEFGKGEIQIPNAPNQAGKEQEDFADELTGPLLINPLKGPSPQQPFDKSVLDKLIVIDGLDELLQGGGYRHNPLEKFLHQLLQAGLPNFRILLTSRPARMYRQLDALIATKRPRRAPEIEQLEVEMKTDALEFIAGELEPLSEDWLNEDVVTELLKKSGSSMLYLHYLAPEIRDGKFSPGNVSQLPNGLAGYYLSKLEEYFPGDKGHARYVNEVRPCLEAVAAGERTDVSVADLELCLDPARIEEMRQSMHALMVERTKTIDGEQTSIFAPFHLSFMDWLLGHPIDSASIDVAHGYQHTFLISEEEGDRTLAQWAWRKYEARMKSDPLTAPNPHEYWIRQGGDQLLRTFNHLHQEKLKPTPQEDSAAEAVEKYRYLVQAIKFLGWLNRFPATKAIVTGARPLLSVTLVKTKEDLSPPVLIALEPVDQMTLFNLVKDSCATDITELVVRWIGRTQVNDWDKLVTEILSLNDYVMRFAAACGLAERYKRHVIDGRPEVVVAEIDEHLKSADPNREEMGSYAVVEILKEQIPKRLPTTGQIRDWLRQISEIDQYFCQSAVGDLLIDLSLRGCHDEVTALAVDIPKFWEPIWEYTRLDVISVLAMRANYFTTLAKHDPLFDQYAGKCGMIAAVQLEVTAIAAREQKIVEAAGRIGADIAAIVRKTELNDADNETVINWLNREGIGLEEQIATAVEFLELMFTHPSWRLCEKGAAILPLLKAARPEHLGTCFAILERMRCSLTESGKDLDPVNWRLIYGLSESSQLVASFDPRYTFDEFKDSGPITRADYCWRRFYKYDNCHVRADLAEGFFFFVGEEHQGEDSWETGRARKLLNAHTSEIRRWLLDTDVWVLEHVYQVFRVIDEKQNADALLQKWVKEQFDYVEANPKCLLARAGRFWVKLGRAEFLSHLQSLQRNPSPLV